MRGHLPALDHGAKVVRRPEYARAGELHRAVADPVEVEVTDPEAASIEVGSRHQILVIRCTGARRPVQDAGAAASLNAQPNSVPVPLALRNSGRQDSTITRIR